MILILRRLFECLDSCLNEAIHAVRSEEVVIVGFEKLPKWLVHAWMGKVKGTYLQ